MRPADSSSATCRFRSPCRSPFGKSKKRTRGSAWNGSSAARVSSSTPSPTTNSSIEAPSWASALCTAYGSIAAWRCVGMRTVASITATGRVSEARRSPRRRPLPPARSTSAAGPPSRCRTNVRSSASSGSSPGLDSSPSGVLSLPRGGSSRACPSRLRATRCRRAMQLDRAAVLRHSRRHGRACATRPGVEDRLSGEPLSSASPTARHRLRHSAEDLECDREVVGREHPGAVDVVVRPPQPTRVVESPCTWPSRSERAIAASSSTPG